MAQWIWAVIAVIGIILIVAVVLLVNRQRRSIALQQRFGPEYTRTVESSEDRRAAEASLTDRARRRAQLEITPLPEPERLRYTEQWRRLQEQFVDRPADAVASAEDLLNRVMEHRGYPVGDFDEQAELVSVDHPHVVENYRVAHDIHRRNLSQEATTEDLREAMLRYRSLFDDLLRPDQKLGDHDHDHDADAADHADDTDPAEIAGRRADAADHARSAEHLADPPTTDIRDDTATDRSTPRRRDLRQEQR